MGLLRFTHAITTDFDHVLQLSVKRTVRVRLIATAIRLYIKSSLLPRRTRGVEERLMGLRVAGFNLRILRFLFREIFIHGDYDFRSRREDPLIVDCGANVGMATLYFLWRYPKAEVHALEPDPDTFAFLERNLKTNGFTNAHAHRLAVSDHNGRVAFYRDDRDPGHPMMSTVRARMPRNETSVECTTLSSFLERHLQEREVDFLKLDVEGAEAAVFEDLVRSGAISRVREFVAEYHHHMGGNPSRLGAFLGLLEGSGFSYRVRAAAVPLAGRRQFQDILLYGYRRDDPAGGAWI